MKLEKFITPFFIILLSLVLSSCSISGRSSTDYLSASIAAPEAPLLAEVIMHLQLDYVHPEKLEPQKLLRYLLSHIKCEKKKNKKEKATKQNRTNN